MYVNPIATMNLNLMNLLSIAKGPSQRTIVQVSRKGYLSKLKVVTNILELDKDHTGEAYHIFKR